MARASRHREPALVEIGTSEDSSGWPEREGPTLCSTGRLSFCRRLTFRQRKMIPSNVQWSPGLSKARAHVHFCRNTVKVGGAGNRQAPVSSGDQTLLSSSPAGNSIDLLVCKKQTAAGRARRSSMLDTEREAGQLGSVDVEIATSAETHAASTGCCRSHGLLFVREVQSQSNTTFLLHPQRSQGERPSHPRALPALCTATETVSSK